MSIKHDLLDPRDRKVTATTTTPFRPYDRYGKPNPMMDWLPLSGDASEGYETFVLKMKPGAKSTPHIHTGGEQFYVIDGTMTDCDGTTFLAGDYVNYKPASRHFSTSENGCTLLVILRGKNEAV